MFSIIVVEGPAAAATVVVGWLSDAEWLELPHAAATSETAPNPTTIREIDFTGESPPQARYLLETPSWRT
jgi:hypothetical protein